MEGDTLRFNNNYLVLLLNATNSFLGIVNLTKIRL